MATDTLDEFTAHYIKTALWSSTYGDDNDDTPMDDTYGPEHLSPEALDKMKSDCAKFQMENSAVLEALGMDGHEYDTFGHDFWLTRNGHGAGFWDGDYPDDIGEALTKASQAFGECSLYIGDDGRIYTYPG